MKKQQLLTLATFMASASAFDHDFYGSEYWWDFRNSDVVDEDWLQCGGCVLAGYDWMVNTDGPRRIMPYSVQEDLLIDRSTSRDAWDCKTAIVQGDSGVSGDWSDLDSWGDYKTNIMTD